MKHGILLINLGTPETATKKHVRQFLHQFLSDKRVIDLPALLRYTLLYAVILPFRTPKTTHAYQSIWKKNGSPLLIHSLSLRNKLQAKLGEEYCVALGMRYGKPSIHTALAQLKNCHTISVLPLYPQYSSAATGSSIEATLTSIASYTTFPSLRIIRDFHRSKAYITAKAALIKPYLTEHDYVLFSYHGLPERQIIQSGCQSVCTSSCSSANLPNTHPACYRAQCYETTNLLATELGLNPKQYSTSFQSRLGRTEWIKPYTDQVLQQLAHQGIRRLAVACPSFVTDCLETLEEIGLRAQKQWLELGGEQLSLIPSLNDNEHWINALSDLLSAG